MLARSRKARPVTQGIEIPGASFGSSSRRGWRRKARPVTQEIETWLSRTRCGPSSRGRKARPVTQGIETTVGKLSGQGSTLIYCRKARPVTQGIETESQTPNSLAKTLVGLSSQSPPRYTGD